MTDEKWIVIPGWDRFQHYADRDPLWIKNYTALLRNDAYLGLTMAERGVLHGLWLYYASMQRACVLNTSRITRALNGRVTTDQILSLIHAGFLEVSASKPLAVPARARVETEKEPPKPPAERGAKKSKKRKTGWKYVRGSHSGTYVRDPEGTDQPPAGYH